MEIYKELNDLYNKICENQKESKALLKKLDEIIERITEREEK